MNWLKYRYIYFAISGILIAVGIFSLLKWGLNLSVDFKGGTNVEYKFETLISTEDITTKLSAAGFNVNSIQSTDNNSFILKLPAINEADKQKLSEEMSTISSGKFEELSFETVGPSIGPELVKKTFYAMGVAAILILLWIAYQFKSIKFGVSAVLAMLHDSLVLIGLYGLLGHFYGGEVDFLFVTAALTILSFSVHDTIVVYDRIRESQRKSSGELRDLANKAISETMVRSLNNSFTIVFMLVALILLGGISIRWFAVALLIGTVSGTYSSPFVAVPLLVTWDELEAKFGKK